jgi:adenine-specific DNA-methyltransferase
MANNKTLKTVETITHEDASRKHIPTAECQSILRKEDQAIIRVAYERRNRDLDPQLVWRGKDEQDWSDLVVNAPPLFIQEKIHPKVLIDDLTKRTSKQDGANVSQQMSLFDEFDGLQDENAKTEFYQHDANWSNRMILGDSLQVMASLAEREGLRGKVQCIYFDPPYGIKFNSNFQWSTTSRDVKDGSIDNITREPEQVKAFRDTWRDGINSYLTYLRDRLTVCRDLLADTGSIFVQIGEENVHLVRSLLSECFGQENFCSQISFVKAGALGAKGLPRRLDYILWFGKDAQAIKFRKSLIEKSLEEVGQYRQIVEDDYSLRPLNTEEKSNWKSIPADRLCRLVSFTKPGPGGRYDLHFEGDVFHPGRRWWGFPEDSTKKLIRAGRLRTQGKSIASLRYWNDYAVEELSNLWTDTASGSGMDKIYVVQTNTQVVKRCVLMATDPGDLVIDPTCGSGTTAHVAEQWGRRWITIDTSRVALALARSRIMGARYPYYILTDSKDGQAKEAEVTRSEPSRLPTRENIRHGFVYERVPHVTLKSISNNSEIDVIWEKYQDKLESFRNEFNKAMGESWKEWEVPRETDESWPQYAKETHRRWWELRIERQKEIDASISAKADFEYLYDKPYEDSKKVRVAGPFTVESLSPHRVLTVDENDELVDELTKPDQQTQAQDFAQMVLENLKTAGVQQAHKEDKIVFSTLKPWPGYYVCAEGMYYEGEEDSVIEKRSAIFIGPEFGTVSRPDLVAAAREAGDAGFDALITCAFNYDAHSSEFNSLGRIPVLKARMNADLHMADDLKNTGKGNLFVIFGEPDIDILDAKNNQVQVKINGVDVFHPNTGEVRSDGAEGIACWFIDTDYNEESFFVRHAYFLGVNDPYQALKTTLKAEINQECWDSLNRDTSRPFDKPKSGRIAVKVINHLGDEVMKVYRVD